MHTREFTVRRGEAGLTVADFLRSRLSIGAQQARKWVLSGNVLLGRKPCRNPLWQLRSGQHVQIQHHNFQKKKSENIVVPRRKPDKRQRQGLAILYQDAHLVVVEKPAGLTTMRHREETAEFGARAKRFLPATLADLLPTLLAPRSENRGPKVRAVHRLDKDTSGLVVFAKTAQAESQLGKQFRAHSIDRRYLALVRGRAATGKMESWLVPDRGDGRRGSSPTAGQGQRAVTHIRVLEGLGEFTLVECCLETGRTHQVRIHLGEAGTPLCGERVYDRPVHGQPLPDPSQFPRVALHAASLGFNHPATGQRMLWTSTLPQDMVVLLASLRQSSFTVKSSAR
jgi:23S rRNA pseudouridine1911/1915/1917 synthase